MSNGFYELSLNKFPKKELGEIADILGGISAPQSLDCFNEGTIPFVRMKDLGRYHLTKNLNKTEDNLREDFVSNNKIKNFQKGTILFPRSGSVHLNHRAILGVDSVVVSHIGGIFIKSKEIIPEFLYWLLVQYDMKKIMNQTTGLNMVKFEDIKKIEIPLPSLEEQKKVVERLDKLEETIKMRNKSNKLMEELILGYYHKLFGSPFYNEMDFQTSKLGEIADLNMGGTPSTKVKEYWEGGDINWIKSGEIKGDFIYSSKNKITSDGIRNSNAKEYPEGDVVIALNGQGKTRAKTAILRIKTSSNQSVASISPREDIILPEYLHFNLKQRYEELRNLTGDNQRSGLNLKILREIKIPLPPIEYQKLFSVFVKKIEEIGKLQVSLNEKFIPLKEILIEKSIIVN